MDGVSIRLSDTIIEREVRDLAVGVGLPMPVDIYVEGKNVALFCKGKSVTQTLTVYYDRYGTLDDLSEQKLLPLVKRLAEALR